jgi:hypothetical protein
MWNSSDIKISPGKTSHKTEYSRQAVDIVRIYVP